MSELIDTRRGRYNIHHRLLATVSSATLLASVAINIEEAKAADGDHPTVWIELGGAFDQISQADMRWLPPNLTPPQSTPPPGPFGKLPTLGYDGDLKVSFAPEDSDWVFSASVRYGRALRGPKKSHDQTDKFRVFPSTGVPQTYYLTNQDFADTAQRSRSTYAILDFQAGKDVGLGMFGGKSTFSVGIRVAQLNENADGHLTAFTSAPRRNSSGEVAHKADFAASRSFSGLGPSVNWDESSPLAGTPSEGFSFDWGANAALLFGRQKANVALQTKDLRYYGDLRYGVYGSIFKTATPEILSHLTQTPSRNRTVLVPNVGGFAGLSWHLPNAKISLGYRADFFFGTMDGGIDAARKENVGFYGPFATISVGLGG